MLFSNTYAQSPLQTKLVEFQIDSGLARNTNTERGVIYEKIIRVEKAPWIRIHFSTAEMGQSTEIKMTSLLDGAVQIHNSETLQEWRNTSAYFNGDAVKVELIVSPGESSRIKVNEVSVGKEPLAQTDENRSICGVDDDRILSNDVRTAKIVPIGCTAWLIDDAQGCFLTAGHCVDLTPNSLAGGFSVIEFDVPLSNPNGSSNHAAPENQYAIDFSSVQWDQTVIGNDWAYFGAFPNSMTQLTPLEAQGSSFILADPPLVPGKETIRISGHGSVDGSNSTPREWSGVQTTHTGPISSINGTVLRYEVDTTGGDSGSAVEVEGTGTSIGIHTNAGCSSTGGSNQATSLANVALQNALANPIGICLNGAPQIRIEQVTPIADDIPSAGSSFEIDVLDRDGLPASINSANLIYDYGDGDVAVPLVSLGEARYQANLPASECVFSAEFKIEVESATTAIINYPFTANNSADRRFYRRVGDVFNDTFRDNFETDKGWTVDNDPSLTAGAWERGVPLGHGRRQDPPWDIDASGSAFLTGNDIGNTDVDNGATRLVSPVLDATSVNSHISYWRWWGDNGTSDDEFVVEVSDDAGASWVTVETVSNGVAAEWVQKQFKVSRFVSNTNQFQIRFIANDTNDGSIIEAGIDDVILVSEIIGDALCPIFKDGFEGPIK